MEKWTLSTIGGSGMRKWYSLIDKVYAMDNLRLAFKHVKSNNGAPGIDGQTVKDFQTRLEENLAAIHAELKTNMYQPSPVRRVEIEKEDGSKRPLGIPTVKDRVVQQALRQLFWGSAHISPAWRIISWCQGKRAKGLIRPRSLAKFSSGLRRT
jgi:retron-type reverse transcriptase